MKALVLLLLLLPFVSAHESQTIHGNLYNLEFGTLPEEITPGQATLIINVLRGEQPVANASTWVRISSEDTVYFSGSFVTDEMGAVPLNYRFSWPGTYTLDVQTGSERFSVPVHVHEEKMLYAVLVAALLLIVFLRK